MSNVVAFPKGRALGPGAERPVVVTITDQDGSTLFSCPVLPPEEGAVTVAPTDPVEVAFAMAALRYALKQLAGPDADPEMRADYTPA